MFSYHLASPKLYTVSGLYLEEPVIKTAMYRRLFCYNNSLDTVIVHFYWFPYKLFTSIIVDSTYKVV